MGIDARFSLTVNGRFKKADRQNFVDFVDLEQWINGCLE